MAKRKNPLFKKTTPATDTPPAVVHPDPQPLNETFPGGLSISPPLSKREKKRLTELEETVTVGILSFVDAGFALREIQANRLHRETHERFDEYIKEMWDMDRSYAYRLIDAVNVLENIQKALPEIESDVANGRHNKNVANWRHDLSAKDIKQIPLLPQNEAQARALAKYNPDKQIEIWREAIQTAKNGKITASHVRATAQAMSRKTVKRKLKQTKQQTTRAPRISDTFLAAFQAFLDQINAERAAEWKHTDPKEIARYLRGLVQAVEAPL